MGAYACGKVCVFLVHVLVPSPFHGQDYFFKNAHSYASVVGQLELIMLLNFLYLLIVFIVIVSVFVLGPMALPFLQLVSTVSSLPSPPSLPAHSGAEVMLQ